MNRNNNRNSYRIYKCIKKVRRSRNHSCRSTTSFNAFTYKTQYPPPFENRNQNDERSHEHDHEHHTLNTTTARQTRQYYKCKTQPVRYAYAVSPTFRPDKHARLSDNFHAQGGSASYTLPPPLFPVTTPIPPPPRPPPTPASIPGCIRRYTRIIIVTEPTMREENVNCGPGHLCGRWRSWRARVTR